MITANATQISENSWRVSFVGPKSSLEEFSPITVPSKAEAERAMYFHNRNYICDKLLHWLNQRYVALSVNAMDAKLPTVAFIHDCIQYHKKSPYAKVCQIVSTLTEKIKSIAPSEKSRYRKYYEAEILPILEFCQPQKS